MAFNRRQALGLLGGALSSPYVLRSADAVPEVEYVQIGSTYGAGFFAIPGCDAAIHIGGFRVTWVNGVPGDPSFAYSRDFQFNGHPTSPIAQLGRPSGPTDGTDATLVTCEARANGGGVNFFCAPKKAATVEEAREIWSNRFSTSAGEVGAPVQVNKPLIGDYVSLCSSPLSNGNIATGYTYESASGIDARVRICNPGGMPVSPERVFADGGTNVFMTDLAANDILMIGHVKADLGTGDTTHWVQRATNAGQKLGNPIEVTPPNNSFIQGVPFILPGKNNDYWLVFLTGTIGNDRVRLNMQHVDKTGRRGKVIPIAFQDTDNFGLFGNCPRCAWTPAGNILAMTDSIEELIVYLFTPVGQLLSRQVLLRRAQRRIRLQAMRMFAKIFVPLWIETDDSTDRSIWHAEVRQIKNEPPPP